MTTFHTSGSWDSLLVGCQLMCAPTRGACSSPYHTSTSRLTNQTGMSCRATLQAVLYPLLIMNQPWPGCTSVSVLSAGDLLCHV
jgi:hypothetical protein